MRGGLLVLTVTLGTLIVPAAAEGALLTVGIEGSLATPLWFRAVADESRVVRVHVEGPGAVAVRASSTTALQLHVFPDVPAALVARPGGFDAVPAAAKERLLGPGDWLVAIDPSVSGSVTATFHGVAGRDTAAPVGAWVCPFDPSSGCLP